MLRVTTLRVPFCTTARSQFYARQLGSLSTTWTSRCREATIECGPARRRGRGARAALANHLSARTFASHKETFSWDDIYAGDPDFQVARARTMERLLNGPNRFQRISEREDVSEIPVETLKASIPGRYLTTHRGCQVMKSADDMIVYHQLLWNLRPATVIELGTFTGGSAIWLADMLRLMDIPSQIFSMDISHSNIEDCVLKLKPDNVTFLLGDCYKIEETFTPEFLKDLPRPWLISDDAHTNIYGTLEHFDKFMETGDYFVAEDLTPNLPAFCTFERARDYPLWGTDKLKAVRKFLHDYSERYAVDSFYTDFFGYNGGCNWHGYIRRM